LEKEKIVELEESASQAVAIIGTVNVLQKRRNVVERVCKIAVDVTNQDTRVLETGNVIMASALKADTANVFQKSRNA
jgi:hypothetical protein